MTGLTHIRLAAHQANQVFGGRGGGLWSASIIAEDLRSAIADPNLLTALARDIRRGDRILLASYANEQDFADEHRDAVCQLLIVDVTKPMTAPDGQKRPGKVAFKVLDLFSLGPTPAKLVQDRGEIEVEPAKKRRAS